MSINEKQFNIDFMRWLIDDSTTPSTSSQIKTQAGFDNNTIAPELCNIKLDLLGPVGIHELPGQNSYVNSFLPSNPGIDTDIGGIPSVSGTGSFTVKGPSWIQLEQANMRNAAPLKLRWINGPVTIGSQINTPDGSALYVGGTPLGPGTIVGPAVLSAQAQFIFALDSDDNIWLVGGAYQQHWEYEAQPVVLFGNASGPISTYQLTISDEPTNDLLFNFNLDWSTLSTSTSLGKTFINVFIESNQTYYRAACLNNQYLDGFWNFDDCSDTYSRDNNDVPNDKCSAFLSKYCNDTGKNIEPKLCGCYLDDIPENLKGIVCDAPDNSGNVDTTGCVPRECILPSCMNGSAFKTKQQMQNNDCHKICSGGLLPILEKGGQFNNDGSEIKLYCGGKTITFGKGKPNIKPDTPSKDPDLPLIISISILGAILIILLVTFIVI